MRNVRIKAFWYTNDIYTDFFIRYNNHNFNYLFLIRKHGLFTIQLFRHNNFKNLSGSKCRVVPLHLRGNISADTILTARKLSNIST